MYNNKLNLAKKNACSIFSALLLLFLLTVVQTVNAQQNATVIPDDIAQLFPTATRVGKPPSDIPVTPVYQLNQLLGYVFESDDFTHFIGFSGETINLLIGLDTEGVITGLKVLRHHEPIFIHGLGEQAMFDFVAQYKDHAITEKIVINARDKTSSELTYFDGVTRATVSVLVINDTVISSALKVAREKLTGFVAPTDYEIVQDNFQPLTFTELLEKGYINHWQISDQQALILAEKASPEAANEIKSLVDLDDGKPFIDLYFGFVNIPIIGKNLLGEQEYTRLLENLKPGEHGLMMFNAGQYSFISEDFIPQTVPKRLSVTQGALPVDTRDVDFYSFYDPSFALPLPDVNDIKLFRIKSQSGFELNKTMHLSLNVPYSVSFMNTKQYKFTIDSQVPEHLFFKNDLSAEQKKQPLWLQIWQSRLLEISAVSIYLCLLLLVFIKQKSLIKSEKATHYVRIAALLFTLFFIGFHAQGQLSVVNIYTLLLSLVNGFNIEVFLLDPVIFILWCFVFVSLFLFGRGLFCGWLCPFGALQEFCGMIANKFKIKQIKIKSAHHHAAQKIKYVILLLLIGCSFYSLTLAEKLAEVEPFKTSITMNFVRYWPFALYAILLLVISLKIHKFYCRYLCPLGAGLAILGRFPIFKWLTRRSECGSPCQLCRTKKCGIDAINENGSIDYSECIQCLECVVVINSADLCVIDKYSKKTTNNRKASEKQIVTVQKA